MIAAAVAASALTAWLFPDTVAAGVASIALVMALGAGAAGAAPVCPRSIPRWLSAVLLTALVAAAGAIIYCSSWSNPGWRNFDWGPHHANLAHMLEGLRAGHIPRWEHSVSSGDASYELYPFLPYYLAARAAQLTDATDLTLVLIRSAIVIHVLGAIGGALLARRLMPWPAALVVGLALLVDVGSTHSGGGDGLFLMGVSHSALANAVWPVVLIATLDALERPRLGASIRIWLGVPFVVACHPLGVVLAIATALALVLVALLARDLPPRRALFALAHVVVGIALAAVFWAPFGARLMLHGIHFATPAESPWQLFAQFMNGSLVETSFVPLVVAGVVGALIALLSRRAAPTLLGAFVAIFLVGLADQVYLLLDLTPSPELARFSVMRLRSAAKIALYVCGMYVTTLLLRELASRWRGRARLLLGAVVAVLALGAVRGAAPFMDRHRVVIDELSAQMIPDPEGMKQLVTWAREQMRDMTPARFGRLLHENGRWHNVYHLNAETGLPTLWVGGSSALFLRERIEDTSPASLRRFNVRWVMHQGKPPKLGDPATERRFGSYIVRELPDWDGRFARVERGRGEAVVTRLDDEHIEVELRGTDEPALVVLGMGYYPRWQARHEQRGLLPVYATPTIPGGRLRAVAAWLPPGRTSFRPTGALPSDGRGRGVAGLAAVLAVAMVVLWSWGRTRRRALRVMARGSSRLRAAGRGLAVGAVALGTLGLVLAGALGSRRPAPALQLGNGLWGAAKVEARAPDTPWTHCSYSWMRGGYRCPQVLIHDATGALLNDAPPSTPFAVPVIAVSPDDEEQIEFRIELEARLAGAYWGASAGGKTTVALDGGATLTLAGRREHAFAPAEEPRTLILTGRTKPKGLQFTLVRRTRLEPDRAYPAPPESPPWR